MLDPVRIFLQERAELECAPLLLSVVDQICQLDADVEAEAAAFGIRFHLDGVLLCEISVFGDLFIVRVGPEQAVEYRVRSRDVALEALDRILREYTDLVCERPAERWKESPGAPVPPAPG